MDLKLSTSSRHRSIIYFTQAQIHSFRFISLKIIYFTQAQIHSFTDSFHLKLSTSPRHAFFKSAVQVSLKLNTT